MPYTLSQNGVAKRTIQITENNVYIMLKNAELSLKLQNKAAGAEAYLRNQTFMRLKIDGQRITLEKAQTGLKPLINYIRVQGYKCFLYVNPKSLPAIGRQDKLIDHGRVTVFMGYKKSIIRQYQIYAPDLGYVT